MPSSPIYTSFMSRRPNSTTCWGGGIFESSVGHWEEPGAEEEEAIQVQGRKGGCRHIRYLPKEKSRLLSRSRKLQRERWSVEIMKKESSRPNSSRAVFDPRRRHWLLGQVFHRFVEEGVDFICLQEIDFKIARRVLADDHGYTRLLTPTGYGQGDHRRPDTANGRGRTRVDACCIFFSPEWELVGKELIVNLDRLAGDGSTKFGRTFKRGNFGIVARLRSVSSGREVLVCNCHLFWDPQFEYVKLAQVHYMCLKVREELDQSSCPVIFCGDLNSKPEGLVHEYLSTGQLFRSPELKKLRLRRAAKGLNERVQEWLAGEETSSTSVLENPIRHMLLESAYSSLGHGQMQEDIELTNKTTDFSGVIDYIFSSSVCMVQSGRLGVPKVQSALPTKKWPSDHLAIGAELVFDE